MPSKRPESPENSQDPKANISHLILKLRESGLSETIISGLTPKITEALNQGVRYTDIATNIDSIFEEINTQGTSMTSDYQARVSKAIEDALDELTQK